MNETVSQNWQISTEMIIQKTTDLEYEMVTGGVFIDHTGTKSTRISKDDF